MLQDAKNRRCFTVHTFAPICICLSPDRSIFTGQPRYTYLDPRYQYTADEWRHILLNEARYQEYLDRRQLERWLRRVEQDRLLYDGQESDKLLTKTVCMAGSHGSQAG